MNLPHDFIERTKPLLGSAWDDFTSSLEQDIPVSIRINEHKQAACTNLSNYAPVPWCNGGYYLGNRPQFTFDPLLHAGCYYVQEASSMFTAQALKQYTGGDIRVLDLCAAPGGKSTLLASLLSGNSLLVSNEVIHQRANILAENMAKWGRANVLVSNNDPAQIGSRLNHYFDVVLVDAPCSGEGMFRKDEGAIAEWSAGNVKLCQQRQRRILADIWNSLKPGGLLMYSTCTYNREENEDNVQWICNELGAESLPIETNESWGITHSLDKSVFAYRFLPHKIKGEGFFLSVMRKTTGEPISGHRLPKSKQQKKKSPTLNESIKSLMNDKEDYRFVEHNSIHYAFPQHLATEMEYLIHQTNTISAGIRLGEMKGKDFIPHQSLALSNALNKDSCACHEINWATAINYLRKEPLTLPDAPKGYILLMYKGIPIGFVKNIGSRANNLYPQEWRIRSGNIPESEICVL